MFVPKLDLKNGPRTVQSLYFVLGRHHHAPDGVRGFDVNSYTGISDFSVDHFCHTLDVG